MKIMKEDSNFWIAILCCVILVIGFSMIGFILYTGQKVLDEREKCLEEMEKTNEEYRQIIEEFSDK